MKLSRHGEFSTQDIRAAICYDKVFCDLFKLGDTFSVTEEPEEPVARNSLTYSEVVDDYMQWEKQYLRDLQMLLKVFREQLANKLEQENEVSYAKIECLGRFWSLVKFVCKSYFSGLGNSFPNFGRHC